MRINAKTTRLALPIMLAFGLGGIAPVHAQDSGAFDAFDANADGTIGDMEYRDGIYDPDWFDDWDADDDDLLSSDEFDAGTGALGMAEYEPFEEWDANDDDFLDEDEFSVGVFDNWDTDNDDLLADDEYDAGIDWFD